MRLLYVIEYVGYRSKHNLKCVPKLDSRLNLELFKDIICTPMLYFLYTYVGIYKFRILFK